MRVLVVRSSPRLAGVEHMILLLADAWQRHGIETGIVTFYRRPPDGPPVHPLVQAARNQGILTWNLPDRGIWDITLWHGLRAIVRAFSPDVVHTHDYKSNWIATGLIPPNRHLVTVHGYTDADARQRLYRWLDRWVIRRAAWVITPSHALARELRVRGYRRTRLMVIPYGLPVKAEQGSTGASCWPVITFASRCSPEKGGDLLLRAVALLQDVHPLRVWVVGDGPERVRWEQLAHRLGVASKVRFWGWRTSPQPFFRHSRLVVMPSRRESFGLVALEAQWVGVPVVASSVGGLPEVVSPWGRLVPPEDPDALARAMYPWLMDWPSARWAGAQARAWVYARFPVEAMQERYLQLLGCFFSRRESSEIHNL